MKIILTTGHPDSGYTTAHEILLASGLKEAGPSLRNNLTPHQIQEKIYKAYKKERETKAFGDIQLSPGKIWQELAADLLISNTDYDEWGWADSRTIRLLDFWNKIEPDIYFVLVYSSPEYAIAQVLKNQEPKQEIIEEVLSIWEAFNTEILYFYQTHTSNCLLVNESVIAHTPEIFIEQAATHFSIDCHVANITTHIRNNTATTLPVLLASKLTEDFQDAIALYRELDSSANILGSSIDIQCAQKQLAWQEYTNIISRLKENNTILNEQAQYIEILDNRIASLNHELAIISDQDEKSRTQNNLYNDKISILQTEYNQAILNQNEQSKTLTDYKQYNEQLTVQLQEIGHSLTKKQSEYDALQSHTNDLQQENELILQQMHQVQEELEQYIVQYQELNVKLHRELGNIAFLIRFWHEQQLSEINIDMRRDISGTNWYNAEPDGRWAGPNNISTLNIPALQEGRYHITLDIADAIDPQIIKGLELNVNGTTVPLKPHEYYGGPDSFDAEFSTNDIQQSNIWQIQFKFPTLISPIHHDSEDHRRLAMRLQSLSFCRI